MLRNFGISNIRKDIDEYVRKAFDCIERHRYDKAIKYANVSSFAQYAFYLSYYDKRIEDIIGLLAKEVNCPIFKPSSNRVCFYDFFSFDNQCISQQYIRAFLKSGVELLYITERERTNPRSQDIFKELELAGNKVKIIYIPKHLKGLAKSHLICTAISAFCASKVFFQLYPDVIDALVAFKALPNFVKKYQINLTDHAYWAGQSVLDFSLEFREHGYNISRFCRSIPSENLIYNPYYPIANNNSFEGFPVVVEDKVVIVAGGSFYKIVDKNNTFIRIVKKLLDIDPKVVFFYAGEGELSVFKDILDDDNYNNRFFLIGFRRDINELIKNCDILLNTYPFGGGLMLQYAAINGKPILNYGKDAEAIEELICQKSEALITRYELKDFMEYAKELICDKDYRLEEGEKLKKCIINEEEFNNRVAKILHDEPEPPSFAENPNDCFDFPNIDVKIQLRDYALALVQNLRFEALLSRPWYSAIAIKHKIKCLIK